MHQTDPSVGGVGSGAHVAGAGEVRDELAAALLGHPGAAGELGDVDAVGRYGGEDADVGHPEVAQGAVIQLPADPPEQAGHQLREHVVSAATHKPTLLSRPDA